MADFLNGIFISEVYADNAGGQAIDVDGDGNANKSDEFIELQNNTGSTISLDGYEVWSQTNGLLYSFGSGDTIASGQTATIIGNYTGTAPAGYFDAGIAEGANFIPDGEGNKFDTIYLVDTTTGDYIYLSYGRPPRPPTPPNGFPGTNQVGSGETIDSTSPNGIAFARDATGTLIETTPTPGVPDIPCFVTGMRVATSEGRVRVERLKPGQLVLTRDYGYQPLRAVRESSVSMAGSPDLAPVEFPALPGHRRLLVSPAHRMLVAHEMADFFFGASEVFAPAHCLGKRVAGPSLVTYWHLLFDTHQIVCAEGYWSESFFAGDVLGRLAMSGSGWTSSACVDLAAIRHQTTARRVLTGQEARVLWDALGPRSCFVTRGCEPIEARNSGNHAPVSQVF